MRLRANTSLSGEVPWKTTPLSPCPVPLVTSPAQSRQRSGFSPGVERSPGAGGTTSPPSLAADSPGHLWEGKGSICRSGWGICSLLESMAKMGPISVPVHRDFMHCDFIRRAPSRAETPSFGPAPVLQGEERSAGSPARMRPLLCWDLRSKAWPFKVNQLWFRTTAFAQGSGDPPRGLCERSQP